MAIVFHFRPARKTNSRTFGLGLFEQKERRLPVGPDEADRKWAAQHLNAETPQYTTEDEDERLRVSRTMTPGEFAELRRAVRETLVIGETVATLGLSEADDAAMDSFIADLLAREATGRGGSPTTEGRG